MVEKTMTIEEILRQDEGLANILLASGMHCLGCAMASGETLEQACAVHGVDPDEFIEELKAFLLTV